ncbi:MAG: glycosyltransferase [Thiolinea sp.]
MLFHRNYLRFQGGHLKVWHYFNHLRSTDHFEPSIFFTPNSVKDANNPWHGEFIESVWSPEQANILFLAGLDWQALLNTNSRQLFKQTPIINLIQGLSHAHPQDVKYAFLKEKAIRICVSPQVSEAIHASGQVNGPVFTINNGLDWSSLPLALPATQKDIDLLIVGIKRPNLAIELEKHPVLEGLNYVAVKQLLPRQAFLQLLNRAKMALFLPHSEEGFYLPALEAMALGSLVICPDSIGNRGFCRPNTNCLMPDYSINGLANAINAVKQFADSKKSELLAAATQTVNEYSLARERAQFLEMMGNLEQLW